MKKSVGILATAFAAFAAAQTQTAPTFREAVEVHVMDLDVVVTDSRGQPVPNLTREDFTVKVDGRPVPIDYFTRVEEGAIHSPDLGTASPERVLAEYRKGEEAYVPRHFLIYTDSGHLSPGLRKRAIEALRDFVTRLGPSDSARLVLFDRRPKNLTEWTTSKEALLAGLSGMEKGVGMSRLTSEMFTLQQIDSTRSSSSRASLARMYAEQEAVEVQTMLRDMNSELATLTAVPGKKAFLFVSGGFETQPGQAMLQYAAGAFNAPSMLQSFSLQSMAPEVEAVVRRANASDITFFTVDARGLSAAGTSASNDDPLASRLSVGFFARQDSQTGLLTLARDTGGLSLVNTNDLEKGFTRVYQDSSTYYSIGVNLSKLPGNLYREVGVDVSRPGLTVRARRGFAPRSASDQGRDVAQAALRTNVEYHAIPVSLRVAPATKAKKYYDLPIAATVPASALTFLPDGDKSRAVVEIYVGAIDDRGYMSEISREERAFTLPRDAPADTVLPYKATLQTRKGNIRVVINFRDKETGRMGTAKADVRVE
ncbi:MAG: VWA domain-containing protein [Thermoanaerobaculia bacterium]